MAITDPTDLPPDWGGDTLARFRYQAEITLPFCMAAALGDRGIAGVIPEYVEDLALDCDSGWRFLQVKSRNLELGLWTLSQLLQKRGALRSLYRTHLCARDTTHTLELVLEGAPKSGDRIMELKREGDRSALEEPVASSLEITTEKARAFLDRVILSAPPPPRDVIAATNRDLIHSHAPHLSGNEVADVHRDLIAEIERAMRAERLGPLWPRSICHPVRRSTAVEERLNAKTLSAEYLATILSGLTEPPRLVLRRLTEVGEPYVSALERKMIEGGATPQIVSLARNLQANARHARYERKSQGSEAPRDILDDLHQRIEAHLTTRSAVHINRESPAVYIWADLLGIFEEHAASIDQSNIFNRDPFLLLGETCDLSDQCRFGWGRSVDAA